MECSQYPVINYTLEVVCHDFGNVTTNSTTVSASDASSVNLNIELLQDSEYTFTIISSNEIGNIRTDPVTIGKYIGQRKLLKTTTFIPLHFM